MLTLLLLYCSIWNHSLRFEFEPHQTNLTFQVQYQLATGVIESINAAPPSPQIHEFLPIVAVVVGGDTVV